MRLFMPLEVLLDFREARHPGDMLPRNKAERQVFVVSWGAQGLEGYAKQRSKALITHSSRSYFILCISSYVIRVLLSSSF